MFSLELMVKGLFHPNHRKTYVLNDLSLNLSYWKVTVLLI